MNERLTLAILSVALYLVPVSAFAGILDINRIERVGEREFTVTCKGGATEKVTDREILMNTICGGKNDLFGYSKLIANVDGSVSLYTPWIKVKQRNHRLSFDYFYPNVAEVYCKIAGYKTATKFNEWSVARRGTPIVALDRNGLIVYAREALNDDWYDFVTCIK